MSRNARLRAGRFCYAALAAVIVTAYFALESREYRKLNVSAKTATTPIPAEPDFMASAFLSPESQERLRYMAAC